MEHWCNDPGMGKLKCLGWQGEAWPSATLFTTNPTQTDLGPNWDLYGKRPATCFIEHYTINTHEELEVWLQIFLTRALDGDDWSTLSLEKRGPHSHPNKPKRAPKAIWIWRGRKRYLPLLGIKPCLPTLQSYHYPEVNLPQEHNYSCSLLNTCFYGLKL
jgi:hypothetical protein